MYQSAFAQRIEKELIALNFVLYNANCIYYIPYLDAIQNIINFKLHVRNQVLNSNLIDSLSTIQNDEKDYTKIDLISHNGRAYRMVAEHDLIVKLNIIIHNKFKFDCLAC